MVLSQHYGWQAFSHGEKNVKINNELIHLIQVSSFLLFLKEKQSLNSENIGQHLPHQLCLLSAEKSKFSV